MDLAWKLVHCVSVIVVFVSVVVVVVKCSNTRRED